MAGSFLCVHPISGGICVTIAHTHTIVFTGGGDDEDLRVVLSWELCKSPAFFTFL